jgi:hypothetical protein
LKIPGGTQTVGFKMVPKAGQGCNLPFPLVGNKRACFPPNLSSLYIYLYAYFESDILHAHVYDRITTFVAALVLYLSCRLIPAEDQEFFGELEQGSTSNGRTRCTFFSPLYPYLLLNKVVIFFDFCVFVTVGRQLSLSLGLALL